MTKLLDLALNNINITVQRDRLWVSEEVKDKICCLICHNFPISGSQCANCDQVYWEPHFYESYLDNGCKTQCCQNEKGEVREISSNVSKVPKDKINIIDEILNLEIKCCYEECDYQAEIFRMIKHEHLCKSRNVVRVKKINYIVFSSW